MKTLVLIVGFLLLTASATADGYNSITDGKPVVLQPDKAYILVRTVKLRWMGNGGPVFVRLLGDDERRRAEAAIRGKDRKAFAPNVVFFHPEKDYQTVGGEQTFIAALQPGTYLLAGIAVADGYFPTSLCLGSVTFEMRPGVVTDLGYVLWASAWTNHDTKIPELMAAMRAKRDDDPSPFVVALRPYADGMSVPASLVNLPKVTADFRAIGPFPNYFHARIDRLLPLPGVLDYDQDGHVIDLKGNAGQAGR